jgi:hypothetical protein
MHWVRQASGAEYQGSPGIAFCARRGGIASTFSGLPTPANSLFSRFADRNPLPAFPDMRDARRQSGVLPHIWCRGIHVRREHGHRFGIVVYAVICSCFTFSSRCFQRISRSWRSCANVGQSLFRPGRFRPRQIAPLATDPAGAFTVIACAGLPICLSRIKLRRSDFEPGVFVVSIDNA